MTSHGAEEASASYPNRFQRLILNRMDQIAAQEGEPLSDAGAARRCALAPQTFADIIRKPYANRQIPNPESIPQIADGLTIPLEDLLDAAAWVAGYRRRRYDESDLTSVVRFWLTDDLQQAETRSALRNARDDLIQGLDAWARRHPGETVDNAYREAMRQARDASIRMLDEMDERWAAHELSPPSQEIDGERD